MKIMAFSARPDEAAFYDYYEKALGFELVRCSRTVSIPPERAQDSIFRKKCRRVQRVHTAAWKA